MLNLHSWIKSSVSYTHTEMMSAEDICRESILDMMSLLISVWYIIHGVSAPHGFNEKIKTGKCVCWHAWGSRPNATEPPSVIWGSTGARLWCQTSLSISMKRATNTYSPGKFRNVTCNSKFKPDQRVQIIHFELYWVYWKFNQSEVKSLKRIPPGDRSCIWVVLSK